MKYSIFRTRLLVICSLIFVCSLWYGTGRHASAVIGPDSIGSMYSEAENGQAVTGVLLSVDNVRLSYAYDVWRHCAASGWEFQYAMLYDKKYYDQEAHRYENKYLSFLSSAESDHRVMIHADEVKNYLVDHKKTDCYKIETVLYQRGMEISRECEYMDASPAESVSVPYSLKLAILQHSMVWCGGGHPEAVSCAYNIYTGIRIGDGKDIAVETEDATVTSLGYAYRNKNDYGYIVESLPEAARPQDKYRYELEGWYTKPEGGEQVSVGSIIFKSTKLYPRWIKIPVTYPVTCIDVLKTDKSEIALGSNTWQGQYGETVSGSYIGEETQPGEYYEGREYTGCSSSVVDSHGATVYRYFKNASMTVTCIDAVTVGPDTGRQLGTSAWDEEYTTVVSGGSLGCDRDVGAYYKGYHYISSSTQRVGVQGCTVYRYFVPVAYDIQFVSNCTSGGIMAPIQNCYYGHEYSLTKNSFIKKNKISFHLNAEDATCDISYQYVYQDFAGWSDSPGGGVLYSDGCQVSSLCDRGGTVKLYAVWSEKEVTVAAQPKRMGYEFGGWSLYPGDSGGEKQFLIDRDVTLYAIWKPVPANSQQPAGTAPSQGSPQPQSSPMLQESALPQGSTPPQGENPGAGGSLPVDTGQVSIISTWIGATPDPSEIAAALAKKKNSNLLKKGSRLTRKGIVYQVTSSGVTKRTVQVIRCKKSFSKLIIPDTVSAKGYSYRVTSLKKKAVANQKNLKKVILGKNIKTIGNKAFYGSRKLQCIVVRAKEIKSVGKSAWKGVAAGCRIRFGRECSMLCKKRVLGAYRQME